MATPALQPQSQTHPLFKTVEPALAQVKESLLSVIPPESQLLAGTVSQSLQSGGKYLRPALTLLIGSATGELDKRLIETAAVSEMIHIATLLHDDVIDQSELRRGKQTIRAALGNKISVLSGDYLLAQASLKLAQLGNTRLVSIYAQVLADLCDGEVEQMRGSYVLDDTPDNAWNSYYRKTYCKTASLFAAGCEAAGVVNGLPEEQISQLITYGKHFGIAFQIVDDLLDYTSTAAEMGKPVLDDLKNGLLNAPALIALFNSEIPAAQRERFKIHLKRFFDGDTDITDAILQADLQEANALEKTRQLAQNAINEACSALNFIPDSPEKQALLDLAQQAIARRS